MTCIWHNGLLVDEKDAIFTASNRIRLGDGVFDTMLVVNSTLMHGTAHFIRLLHDARLLGIEPDMSVDELKNAAQKLIKENKMKQGDYALSTLITGGPGERGLAAPKTPEPQIVMRLVPAPEEQPPLHATIARNVRRNEGSPLSRIKSCNYGDNILALKEATEKGACEAIMLNNQSHVACGTTGNIFAIINGNLHTPPLEDGVLDGITRRLLIEKYDVREQSLTEETLLSAENIFLTNSLRGAVPVVSLDGQNFPTPSLPIDKDFHLK